MAGAGVVAAELDEDALEEDTRAAELVEVVVVVTVGGWQLTQGGVPATETVALTKSAECSVSSAGDSVCPHWKSTV